MFFTIFFLLIVYNFFAIIGVHFSFRRNETIMKKNADIQKNWENTLSLIKDEVTAPAYDTWFSKLTLLGVEEKSKQLHLETEREIIVTQINERYIHLLENMVSASFDENYRVVVSLRKKEPAEKSSVVPVLSQNTEEGDFFEENYLNPRYNFDTFVVGNNNEFAYSVALAVAENPAVRFNPLFLYGGSGLGKTHLMHSIGKYILDNHKDKNVLYVSSEMFTNELVKAIRDHEIGPFKEKYRNTDVLLIDDIQFIEGKESTQEEFFHTFNALYDRSKQIVISSDRSPSKLVNLDERLTSRFLWSITADIQPPSYETRVAILTNKAEYENIEITEDVKMVINLIAEKIKFNVRELEGALERIIAFSSLLNRPITYNSAKEILSELITAADTRITIEAIKSEVSKKYGISIKDMVSSKRNKEIVYPRQVALYLCKELTNNSLPKIGSSFGGRDHTTVLHACKKISALIKEEQKVKEEIDELIASLNMQ